MTHKAQKMCYLDLCRKDLLTSPLGHSRENVREAAGYSATYWQSELPICKVGYCLELRPLPVTLIPWPHVIPSLTTFSSAGITSS